MIQEITSPTASHSKPAFIREAATHPEWTTFLLQKYEIQHCFLWFASGNLFSIVLLEPSMFASFSVISENAHFYVASLLRKYSGGDAPPTSNLPSKQHSGQPVCPPAPRPPRPEHPSNSMGAQPRTCHIWQSNLASKWILFCGSAPQTFPKCCPDNQISIKRDPIGIMLDCQMFLECEKPNAYFYVVPGGYGIHPYVYHAHTHILDMWT